MPKRFLKWNSTCPYFWVLFFDPSKMSFWVVQGFVPRIYLKAFFLRIPFCSCGDLKHSSLIIPLYGTLLFKRLRLITGLQIGTIQHILKTIKWRRETNQICIAKFGPHIASLPQKDSNVPDSSVCGNNKNFEPCYSMTLIKRRRIMKNWS